MTLNEFRKILVKLVQRSIRLTAIFDEQPDPEPRKPYCYIAFGVERSLAPQDEQSNEIDDDGNIDVKGERIRTITFEVRGKGALAYMELLKNSLSTPTILQWLRGKELAMVRTFNINNLTDILEVDRDDRAQMDVELAYRTLVQDNVGWIEYIEINDDVYHEGEIVEL